MSETVRTARPPNLAREYRRLAAEAELLAADFDDEPMRQVYLLLAEAWTKLANGTEAAAGNSVSIFSRHGLRPSLK